MLNDQSQAAQDFLDKHIYARANLLIDELTKKLPDATESPWYEDLFYQYKEPDIWEEDPDWIGTNYCPPEPDPEFREPYEFWIVSDFFAQKLKKYDYLLTNHWGFWIWGRETTGQSILIDWVFQKIWDDHKNS